MNNSKRRKLIKENAWIPTENIEADLADTKIEIAVLLREKKEEGLEERRELVNVLELLLDDRRKKERKGKV